MISSISRWLAAIRRDSSKNNKTRRKQKCRLRGQMERLETRAVPAFMGGVSTASGDVNGDGFADIVTGAGPGGAPMVKIFNGKTGGVSRSFNAFDSTFKGGVNVALGDVNGDGRVDIITGTGPGGSSRVRVFDGLTGARLLDFAPYNRRFKGGVNVAGGDVTGDGKADIITGAGPGGGSHVIAFDGTNAKIALSIAAFPGFTGGTYVAAGDVTGDGRADIVTGAGAGGLPLISVFDSKAPTTANRTFFAYNTAFRGGVRVGTADLSTDTAIDIVAGAGQGGAPHVVAFSGASGKLIRSFLAYDKNFTGGVNIASGADINATGNQEILVGPGPGGNPSVVAFDGDTNQKLVNFMAFEPNTSPGAFAKQRDITLPALSITSPTGSPTQKTNITVTGKASDTGSGIANVQVSVDNGVFQNVSFFNGTFTFASSFPLNGTDDGAHSLRFQARDRAGNVSAISTVNFTLDTRVTQPTLDLDSASDTGTKGDLITSNAQVTLNGKSDANVIVELVGLSRTTKADAQGNFSFANVNLNVGANMFTVRAADTFGNSSDRMVTITLNSGPTVTTPLNNVTVNKNAANTTIDLSNFFTDVDVVNSLIRFNTSEGSIEVELFDRQTPLTVANFLNYINRGSFTSSIFHRLVNNFVLQGGGFQFTRNPTSQITAIPTDPPVQNEPGISNLRGTVAMAKLGGDPNSATSQFFFNLGDNSENLDNQNGGFTVFGRVTNGLDVIDRLAAYPISNQGAFNSALDTLPLRNYTGTNFPADSRFANFAGINTVNVIRRSDRLTFSVQSNSNTTLVTPTVVGNQLTLAYAPGQTGTSTITIRATDLDGSFVESTFTVTVNG